MRATSGPTRQEEATEQLAGAERFGARSVIGWLVVVLALVPFLTLWLLIRDASSALARLDRTIAADLNEAVHGYPRVVDTLRILTELAGTVTAVVVFAIAILFLAIQRRWRLALFTAVTAVGLEILIPVSKALIGRARPVVEVPVAEAPGNASFPSGHSMTAVVLWGTLVLLALPAVRQSVRPWVVGGAVVLMVAIGGTRLALGVHFLSDVLAGWALGAAWLAAMVVSFRTWPGVPHEDRPVDPLRQDSADMVKVERPRCAIAPIRGRDLSWLSGAAVLIAASLTALGLLVTGPWQDTWIGRWDRQVVAYMVEVRSSALTDVATIVSALSGTATVVAVALAIGMLALAATGSWRPALFVVIATIGEALLYFVVSRLVDRPRPEVADLTAGLPSAASWPSGHVAAAVVLYGALAAVLMSYSSSWLRWAAVGFAVLIPLAVSVSRLYLAAHYPTDVIAGLALGAAWLLACAHWLLPPDAGRSARSAAVGADVSTQRRPS